MDIEKQSVAHLENWVENGFSDIFDQGYEIEDVLWTDENGNNVFQIKNGTELRPMVYLFSNKNEPNNLVLLMPPLIVKNFDSNNN